MDQKTRKDRKDFTVAAKNIILRRHFVDQVPISELCKEHDLHVSTFYLWQKKLSEGTLGGGKTVASSREKELERKVAALEVRLVKKDGVIDKVTQEYVSQNVVLGRPERQVGCV